MDKSTTYFPPFIVYLCHKPPCCIILIGKNVNHLFPLQLKSIGHSSDFPSIFRFVSRPVTIISSSFFTTTSHPRSANVCPPVIVRTANMATPTQVFCQKTIRHKGRVMLNEISTTSISSFRPSYPKFIITSSSFYMSHLSNHSNLSTIKSFSLFSIQRGSFQTPTENHMTCLLPSWQSFSNGNIFVGKHTIERIKVGPRFSNPCTYLWPQVSVIGDNTPKQNNLIGSGKTLPVKDQG